MIAAEPAAQGALARSDQMVGLRTAWVGHAMGGELEIHLGHAGHRGGGADDDATGRAQRDAARAGARVIAWANRLTRFDARSDLMRLNADSQTRVAVRPTLGRALDWANEAEDSTDGLVTPSLLDARLAAEAGMEPQPFTRGRTGRRWQVSRTPGRAWLVERAPGLRLDLDGFAKGWLADRALALLGRYPSAVVAADGDIAVRVAAGDEWLFGVADPGTDTGDLAVMRLAGGRVPETFGLATSGTTVHRWAHGDRTDHHLIDPATRRPARTDLVQATVLASSARRAEILAKAALILGSQAGLRFLEASTADGAILLTDRGERLALTRTLRWLDQETNA